MHKYKVVVMLILPFIILTGCQNNNSAENLLVDPIKVESKYDNITNELKEEETKVGIYVDQDIYTLPFSKLVYTIENTGENSVEYDNSVYLDKLQDETWVQIPYKENLEFTMEAVILEPDQSDEQEIALEHLDYQLTKGNYRIRKEIQDEVMAVPFEIKDQ